jgi:hypothetical protein
MGGDLEIELWGGVEIGDGAGYRNSQIEWGGGYLEIYGRRDMCTWK